jgi:hypothetical protein
MVSKIFKAALYFVIVFGIVTLFILYFCKFPQKVDVVRPAVSFYEKDSSSINRTSIRVSGTLYRPFFRQHEFKGTVTIDGFDFTKQNSTLPTYILDKNNGINMGNLVYHKPSKPWDFVTLGTIWFDDNFEHINIASNWGENKKMTYFIVSASSYEEAVATQIKMREKYGATFVPRE